MLSIGCHEKPVLAQAIARGLCDKSKVSPLLVPAYIYAYIRTHTLSVSLSLTHTYGLCDKSEVSPHLVPTCTRSLILGRQRRMCLCKRRVLA